MIFQNKFDKLLSNSLALSSDSQFDIRADPKYKKLVEKSSNYLTLALSTPGFEADISQFVKDFTTPSGINPFLTPTEFLQYKEFLTESFHIPSSVANDLLNFNAVELCGATIATIALLLDFDKNRMDKLGQYTGRLLLSSYLAGNPALLLLTAVCLGQICCGLWKDESAVEILNGAVQGGLYTGTFFFVAAHFTGPIFIGIAVSAVACFGINWLYQQISSNLRNDLDAIFESQFSSYPSYYRLLT